MALLQLFDEKKNLVWVADGGKIGGSLVHFPSGPVKCLADLRKRENRQRYSRYMKIRDQKYRTLKDQTVRRVLKDNKVPGT